MVSWIMDCEGVYLLVKDIGIGIDLIYILCLIECFYWVDLSWYKDMGGIGLGLVIVKYVLLNYDGLLDICSNIGIGSEFVCYFLWECLVEWVLELIDLDV